MNDWLLHRTLVAPGARWACRSCNASRTGCISLALFAGRPCCVRCSHSQLLQTNDPCAAASPVQAEVEWTQLRQALQVADPPCRHSAERWWSRNPDDVAAIEACLGCPVLHPCDRYATAAREPAGVRGGVDRERRTS